MTMVKKKGPYVLKTGSLICVGKGSSVKSDIAQKLADLSSRRYYVQYRSPEPNIFVLQNSVHTNSAITRLTLNISPTQMPKYWH